jgi:hypothetical protein
MHGACEVVTHEGETSLTEDTYTRYFANGDISSIKWLCCLVRVGAPSVGIIKESGTLHSRWCNIPS